MTVPSNRIFHSRSFIVMLIFGIIAIGYTALHLKVHEAFAFSFFGDIFFIWVPLLVCFIAGITCLVRYRKSRELNEITLSLIPVLLIFIVILLGFFKDRQSRNPIVFQVSNGDLAGGLCLQLRTDSLYTLLNNGSMGYSWYQGHYSIHLDTIILTGGTGAIDDKLIIKRNSSHCPASLAYRYKKETAFREDELHVVFDSLFCKK